MLTMPSLFVCHGAPTMALEDSEYTSFLRTLPKRFAKPAGVILFSAHWEKDTISVTHTDQIHETIYDFYGFPDELYNIRYPATGSTALSGKLAKYFSDQGIDVKLDTGRGLDHGAWVVLHLMYPEGDIPVVQVSINPHLSPEEQYRIGQIVSRLRDENILVIGSGATVHNLLMLAWGEKGTEQWAAEFDDWLIDAVSRWDLQRLFTYEKEAPHALQAVPHNEHLVPLFISMGAGDRQKKAELLHRSYSFGSLSQICWAF